jgi:hypothetical protein
MPGFSCKSCAFVGEAIGDISRHMRKRKKKKVVRQHPEFDAETTLLLKAVELFDAAVDDEVLDLKSYGRVVAYLGSRYGPNLAP